MNDIDKKHNSRRIFLKQTVAATVGIAATVVAYEDSIITGTNNPIYQEGAGKDAAQEPPVTTLDQLSEYPASRSSLIVYTLLTTTLLQADLDKVANGKVKPYLTYEEDKAATAQYEASSHLSHKQPLLNVAILDPQKAYNTQNYEQLRSDKNNFLHFDMVANYRDSDTDFAAAAFYNAQSKTLAYIFPGVDVSNPRDWSDLFTTVRNQPNPQL